jgi:hypothetical protein
LHQLDKRVVAASVVVKSPLRRYLVLLEIAVVVEQMTLPCQHQGVAVEDFGMEKPAPLFNQMVNPVVTVIVVEHVRL